ncbi:MAG: GTP cyclohydrolase I FolE [Deltaproteobacteria bacterium]|jgi:GTP cyclohydrolase I|nr:GTP cyclohydrolase I FolE [Deltaproteobacteria bacterium]
MSLPDPIEDLVRSMLKELGEDPGRNGLDRTPSRVASAMRTFTSGYDMDPFEILNDALFEVAYNELVLVRDIDFYSLCEHHMVPFFGRVHVGYIPNGRVVGLSKIPRLVEMFARRLQVQERLTTQIAETLEEVLAPKGVGVVIEAKHLCMMMRGVQKQNSYAITSSLRGEFETDSKTRAEFMGLLRQNRDAFA